MVPLLLGLVSGCACYQGHIHAAAVQARLCFSNPHVHIIHILNGQPAGGQVSRQKLMEVGSRRPGNCLALKALRRGQAVIL